MNHRTKLNKRWTLLLALMLALLTTAGCASAEPAAQTAERPDAQALTEMILDPNAQSEEPSFQSFHAVTMTGEAVTEDLFASHKVTMLNIWATFCGPCIMEMPDLAALNQAYGEGEFQVVGVVADLLDRDGISGDALELAWSIIDSTGANYPHLLPGYDLAAIKLNQVSAVPETLFFDSEGNLLNPDVQYLGSRSYDDWKAVIDELLAGQAE